MTKIAAKPVLFKAPVSIGSDEYTAHLSQCEWVPTQPTASFTDLDGKVVPFGGASSWVLNLGGVQDWETVNSLSAFLNEHEGEEITVSADVAGGTWTGVAIAAAVNVGGTINSPAVWSKTLQSYEPIFTSGS